MNKFKVGDLVRGTKNKMYGIVNEQMELGEVIAAYKDGDIRIRILEHVHPFYNGHTFVVKPQYFEPVGNAPKIVLSPDNTEDIDWLTYKAYKIIERLSERTGMPTERVISQLIIGAEKLVEIEDGTKTGEGKGEEE